MSSSLSNGSFLLKSTAAAGPETGRGRVARRDFPSRARRVALVLLVMASLAASAGCDALTSTNEDDSQVALLLGVAVASQFTLTFTPTAGTTVISCSAGGSANTYNIAGVQTASMQDMRLYVHNIRLVSGATEVPVALTQDGTWQYANVALLDFEDASGDCNGTAATNHTLRGTVTPGSYSAVRFTVGVPENLNHTDVSATDTPTPLNIAAMNWAWAVGRKFMRFEAKHGSNTATFHLGAQSCSGTAPSVTCSRVDRPEVELAVGSRGNVRLDIQELFGAAAWSIVSTSKSCHSNPGAPANCADIFPKLGLSWSDGSADRSAQTVFRSP